MRTRCIAAMMLAATASGSSEAAEDLLSTGPADNYQVRVTSWSEIPFRSVVRQRYDFSCGSAAVATLLSFHYDRATPEAPIFAAMWATGDHTSIRKSGFSMLDIKRYLDGIGYTTQGYHLSVDQLRQAHRPGIVILDLRGYKHFVVVKGVTADRVLVGDPMIGLSRYSTSDFGAHWNGVFLVIVKNPRELSPRFNLASEWARWSAAPLQIGTSRTPIATLTDNLPPVYQITSSTAFTLGAAAAR